MVLHATCDSSVYTLSLKPHSLAVSVDETHVVSWDLGGRLYSAYHDDVTWRRGLSGHLLEKRGEGAERIRRLLPPMEADAVVDGAAGLAVRVLDAMQSAPWRWTHPIDGIVVQEIRSHLALCAQFNAARAAADAARFAAVYAPVGILPPDQYLSLVVQATEGCSFNTCTFCDLYHDGYRVKTQDQFRAHVEGVRAFLGESVSLRSRGIFLGAANALAVPMARLVPLLETLVEELDAIRRGVFAFVDGFTGQRKTASDYRLLSHLGLRRVYIGLESGHDPLLAHVRKPGTAADAVEAACAIKAAGVNVGVIVMTGLGGRQFAAGHEVDTIAAVNAMGLGSGDLLYFSDLVEIAGTAYPRLAQQAHIQPLSPEDRRTQQQAIKAGLRFPGQPPQFATYDVREFLY